MEPIAVVLAQYFARFQFDDFSDTFAQVTLDKVVVIDFTEEADTLAVLAHGAGELLFGSDGTDFRFHQVADREHQLLDLQARDLSQEIGLVLHRVFGGGEPYFSVYLGRCGIMAGGDFIEVFPPFLFEAAELDEFVAHHVRVGGEAALHRVDRVADHLVPVFVMQGYHFHATTVFACYVRCNFYILFGGAVDISVFIFHTDTDIEDGRIISRLLQLMDNYGAVHTS